MRRAARLASRIAAAFVGVALGPGASPAVYAAQSATGATLVAIVTAEPNGSLARRVREHLQALGVDVLVLKPPEEASPGRAPLEQAARGVGAIAAIRLVSSGEGKVEVWVADRVTGKAVVRELQASSSDTSDEDVAVASVELLRASLMELHAGRPTHGDVPPTRQIEALALSAPRPAGRFVPRLALQAGAGAELGAWTLGPSPDASIALWARIVPNLGATVVAHASLAAAEVSAGYGSVDVRSQVFGAMATYAPTGESSPWTPTLSLGFGAAHVSASGKAEPPLVSEDASTWCAAPLVGVGLGWAFVPGMRLRADALSAAALPAVHVRAAGTSVGQWGAPAVFVSMGLEMLWGPPS
jgi:hypothetical protein